VRINEELPEREVAALVYKTEINDRGGSATPIYPQKLTLNFVKWQSSVGIVRLRTKGHEVCSFVVKNYRRFGNNFSACSGSDVTQIKAVPCRLQPMARYVTVWYTDGTVSVI
jgi:hypothetical protein